MVAREREESTVVGEARCEEALLLFQFVEEGRLGLPWR